MPYDALTSILLFTSKKKSNSPKSSTTKMGKNLQKDEWFGSVRQASKPIKYLPKAKDPTTERRLWPTQRLPT
eukprot:scaffold4833_cov233-Amphora_coffeaeformis.AAC.23